jgi:hypothetical protein
MTLGLVATARGQSTAGPAVPAEVPTRMEPVTVTGAAFSGENTPLGDYQQPEWTARRRFVTTRVYVQPAWQVEMELGYDFTQPADGPRTRLFQQEIEIGLPHRFQLDVENVSQDFKEGGTDERVWHHESNSVELRYAFADWGKIPLNPTANVEWKFNSGAADAYEFQLLLGEDLSPRWHWGMNFFFEQQIGDDQVREKAVSQAFGYSLIEGKLSIGAEMKYSEESDKDSRGSPERRFAIGPSVQWRPTPRTHVDLVPLWGTTEAAARWEVFLFFGFEFGSGSERGDAERLNPASLRGK